MGKLLNEQRFITNFVLAVFNAIVGQRNKALDAAMKRDPEFKAIVQQLEKGRQDLERWVEKWNKNDPEAQKDLALIRQITRVK